MLSRSANAKVNTNEKTNANANINANANTNTKTNVQKLNTNTRTHTRTRADANVNANVHMPSTRQLSGRANKKIAIQNNVAERTKPFSNVLASIQMSPRTSNVIGPPASSQEAQCSIAQCSYPPSRLAMLHCAS